MVPRTQQAVERFLQASALLPRKLRQGAEDLPEADKARVEELRLRAGRPPAAVLPGCQVTLPAC